MEHHHHRMLSVWFFIGVLLLAYGVIILAVGLMNFHRTGGVILGRYHAPVWGGAILLLFGLIYTIGFWPKRGR